MDRTIVEFGFERQGRSVLVADMRCLFAGKARPERYFQFTLFAVMALLPGCTVPEILCVSSDATQTLSLRSTETTNGGSALAVDLVFVRSEILADELSKLEAVDYFKRREQIGRDHPTQFESRRWELAPGQIASDVDLDPPCGVTAVLLFADFQAPGAHRLRLDDRKDAQIVLNADTLQLIE